MAMHDAQMASTLQNDWNSRHPVYISLVSGGRVSATVVWFFPTSMVWVKVVGGPGGSDRPVLEASETISYLKAVRCEHPAQSTFCSWMVVATGFASAKDCFAECDTAHCCQHSGSTIIVSVFKCLPWTSTHLYWSTPNIHTPASTWHPGPSISPSDSRSSGAETIGSSY